MREFLVSYMGTEPPPTGGERPQAAQLLPACHMPTARILDLWEDHTMLKRQPHHQARLGGHQQLPLSLLVRQDQGDVHGKARPMEITLRGYEAGGLATTTPPLHPSQTTHNVTREPLALPPASLFCAALWGGVQCPALPRALPTWGSQVGVSRRALRQEPWPQPTGSPEP